MNAHPAPSPFRRERVGVRVVPVTKKRPAGRRGAFSRTRSVSAYAATLSLAFAAARFTLTFSRSAGWSSM